MQSRLAATVTKLNRVLCGSPHQFLPQRFASASIAVHAVKPEEVGATEGAEDEKRRHSPEKEPAKEPYVTPKPPTHSSPKLESAGVNERIDPITHQKRQSSSTSSESGRLEDLSCAGLDGSPWPDVSREPRKEQLEDDRKYFEDHKASPLSEIEIADTRKPMTRATDGTAQNYTVGGGDGVVLWRPEQLDTAEDSLRRAMEMFRESAMSGDSNSPHGRVLRALRGENW